VRLRFKETKRGQDIGKDEEKDNIEIEMMKGNDPKRIVPFFILVAM